MTDVSIVVIPNGCEESFPPFFMICRRAEAHVTLRGTISRAASFVKAAQICSHSSTELVFVFLPLAPESRDVDAENGRGIFQCWRASHHARDMFALDIVQRKVAADLR